MLEHQLLQSHRFLYILPTENHFVGLGRSLPYAPNGPPKTLDPPGRRARRGDGSWESNHTRDVFFTARCFTFGLLFQMRWHFWFATKRWFVCDQMRFHAENTLPIEAGFAAEYSVKRWVHDTSMKKPS